MGIKKFLSLSVVTAMVMILLCSCGAAPGGAAMDMDYAYKNEAGGIYDNGYESPAMDSMESVTDGSGTPEAGMEQKLIKTVDMSVETEDLTKLLGELDTQIAGVGGYVEKRTVYNGSSYNSYRTRNAELTVRVPAENLDNFVARMQGMSNIISASETVDDVTLRYVAVESRMKALETERDRLMELMAQAETISDLLEVEARLTDVVSELESVTSQLRVLQNQVSYATVKLSIGEVKTLTVVEEETVWQRMTRGFAENLKGLGNGIVEFAIFVVVSLPYLVPLGGIAAVVVILIRRKKAKKKVASAPRFPEQKPETKE